jgi:hypothetical protein
MVLGVFILIGVVVVVVLGAAIVETAIKLRNRPRLQNHVLKVLNVNGLFIVTSLAFTWLLLYGGATANSLWKGDRIGWRESVNPFLLIVFALTGVSIVAALIKQIDNSWSDQHWVMKLFHILRAMFIIFVSGIFLTLGAQKSERLATKVLPMIRQYVLIERFQDSPSGYEDFVVDHYEGDEESVDFQSAVPLCSEWGKEALEKDEWVEKIRYGDKPEWVKFKNLGYGYSHSFQRSIKRELPSGEGTGGIYWNAYSERMIERDSKRRPFDLVVGVCVAYAVICLWWFPLVTMVIVLGEKNDTWPKSDPELTLAPAWLGLGRLAWFHFLVIVVALLPLYVKDL